LNYNGVFPFDISGLWSADLTITQLILETVVETERGTSFAVYSRKMRGHLFHFEKCCGGKWATVSRVQTSQPPAAESA
jgi:hypothetical protein